MLLGCWPSGPAIWREVPFWNLLRQLALGNRRIERCLENAGYQVYAIIKKWLSIWEDMHAFNLGRNKVLRHIKIVFVYTYISIYIRVTLIIIHYYMYCTYAVDYNLYVRIYIYIHYIYNISCIMYIILYTYYITYTATHICLNFQSPNCVAKNASLTAGHLR